jgi:hypothetical protein
MRNRKIVIEETMLGCSVTISGHSGTDEKDAWKEALLWGIEQLNTSLHGETKTGMVISQSHNSHRVHHSSSDLFDALTQMMKEDPAMDKDLEALNKATAGFDHDNGSFQDYLKCIVDSPETPEHLKTPVKEILEALKD